MNDPEETMPPRSNGDDDMTAEDTMTEEDTTRPAGRPNNGDGPSLPAAEVDRLLVFGEVVTCKDGVATTVSYPSYRELAKRYDVSHALIAKFSKDHNCMRRRMQNEARVEAQTDQKLVQLRSTALALAKDDALRMIDTYLMQFEEALLEGRVRVDNPSDFNTMVRLKNFIEGGADSRKEINATVSISDLQARHKAVLRAARQSSPAIRGELPQLESEIIDVTGELVAKPESVRGTDIEP